MELADTWRSGRHVRKDVEVQILSGAFNKPKWVPQELIEQLEQPEEEF